MNENHPNMRLEYWSDGVMKEQDSNTPCGIIISDSLITGMLKEPYFFGIPLIISYS